MSFPDRMAFTVQTLFLTVILLYLLTIMVVYFSSPTVNTSVEIYNHGRVNIDTTSTAEHTQCSIFTEDNTVRSCLTGNKVYKYNRFVKTELLSHNGAGKYSETSLEREKSFSQVFQKKSWGPVMDGDVVVSSGPGSTLVNTQEVMGVLHTIINFIKQITGKNHVTMLDVPCGDMTWMSKFLKTRDDIYYTGIDIVSDMISNHQNTYKEQSKWKFVTADILNKSTTVGKYDLVFSRMMMQHLYHYDVIDLLRKISQSGSKYVLMTTYRSKINLELLVSRMTRFRALNLQIAPFNLTPPLCIHRDGQPDSKETFLGLWKLPLYYVNNCQNVEHKMDSGSIYIGCGSEGE